MEPSARDGGSGKKLKQPTSRPQTTALFILRALQIGFSYEDLFFLDVGFITDVITEKNNDSYDWPIEGTAEDLKKLMGGL